MRRNCSILFALACSVLLSACAMSEAAPTATSTPWPPTATNTATATDTPLPPTATLTHTPTATHTATNTPIATYTATPTATNTSEPTPVVVCPRFQGVPSKTQVKFTVINATGYDVYLKLDSCSDDGFYYLTLPEGSSDSPVTKVYSIFPGAYRLTYWSCNGLVRQRSLEISGNQRWELSSCEVMATATVAP